MSTQKKTLSQLELARAYVAKMDPAIQKQGGDRQTFAVACKVVEFGLNSTDAMVIMNEFNGRCQPSWSESSLARKLKCAYARAKPNPKFVKDGKAPLQLPEVKSQAKWPKLGTEARQSVIVDGIGLSELNSLSPVSFDLPSTYPILQILFPDNPLLCFGKASMQFWTRRLSLVGPRAEFVQFIVPSPMSKQRGFIKDPKPEGPFESEHSLDNTGPRRYAVVEFDEGSSDEHSALLWHLSEFAPLIMAVHSGGKSLHGWFFVGGESEDRIFRFYRYAVWLGADRATHLRSQFVRMPDGRRDNGVRQAVHYFNPSLIK